MKRRAVISGLLGASASAIGKLALDPDSPVQSRARSFCLTFISDTSDLTVVAGRSISSRHVCTATELIGRGLCLLMMIGCNATMMATFLDGMNESGSVAGTALANAASFAMSAIYGILFFDEKVNTTWMMGFAMIMSGAWLLSDVRLKQDTRADAEKKSR
mmetsp:Transcript_14005/g.30430  ORF Transcript_14005/g.30430 Transcript_14005/m.30430 type:complete len:160 (+) Transcript_14005:212-691(+)